MKELVEAIREQNQQISTLTQAMQQQTEVMQQIVRINAALLESAFEGEGDLDGDGVYLDGDKVTVN